MIPQYRSRLFDLFDTLLFASGAVTNRNAKCDRCLPPCYIPSLKTSWASHPLSRLADHFALAPARSSVAPPQTISSDSLGQLDAHAVVEIDRTVAATGGILFHYNPPYGDIYMEVAEPFRRRGLGSYLVQELKRVCYQRGNIPAARCNLRNLASRKTLQKAGFVPCGHLLAGAIAR